MKKDDPNEEDKLDLKKVLDAVPKEFQVTPYNPMPSVVKILQSVTQEEEDHHTKLQELEENFDNMEAAMNLIVEVYYQGFNKSIKNYSQILNHVLSSQKGIQTLRTNLEKSRKYLYSRSAILKKLWKQNLEYKEMIRILDKIEELKQVKPKLESYINGKHYLHAAKLLIASVNELFGEDLLEVQGMEELRKDLLERKNTFHELLIDELHDFIYLRKYYQESTDESEDLETKYKQEYYLNEISEDLTKDPLLDRKGFMKVIVEALHVLDRLPTALSALNSQSPVQLRSIINITAISIKDLKETSDSPKLNALNRLLSTVLPRFLRILKNHMFLSTFIAKRYMDFTSKSESTTMSPRSEAKSRKYNSNPYTIQNVWLSMQREVESLVLIHMEGQSANSVNTALPIGSNPPQGGSLKVTRTSGNSEKKKLFHFVDSSAATFKDFKNQHSASTSLLSDPLIKPSPNNMAAIYPQLVKFDEDCSQLFLNMESSLTSVELHNFIDECIVNSFLPHIKKDYGKKLDRALEANEAFKIPEKQKLTIAHEESQKTLTSTLAVCGFVKELFEDITVMPKYTDKFANLIETMLVKYVDRCHMKFVEITSDTECARKLGSQDYIQQLTSDPLWKSMNTHFTTKIKRSNSGSSLGSSSHEENDSSESYREAEFNNEMPIYLNNSNAITPTLLRSQLITDLQKFTLLAALNDSLSWLATSVESLGSSTSHSTKDPKKPKKVGILGISNKKAPHANMNITKLVPNMDTLLKNIRTLSDTCIFALRTELRLHCYYSLDHIKKTPYVLEEEPGEPDQFILDMNRELSGIEDSIQNYLTKVKMRYLFDGLAHLISNILIKSLRKVKNINKNGVQRMLRNVFALQQNLTNIIQFKETHFDRVRKYYRLLYLSEEEILATVSSQSADSGVFSVEEYRTILSLLQSKEQKTLNERIFNILEDLVHKTKRGAFAL